MLLRKATEKDIPAIAQLFKETIETINSKDYSEKQVSVWSEGHTHTKRWILRLTSQYFIVAVVDEIITGIGSITPDGYLDLMYVHKDYQGKGIGSALLDELLTNAINNNLSLVKSDVSITAKTFFEKKGFAVDTAQKVQINGIELLNYKMQKKITGLITGV